MLMNIVLLSFLGLSTGSVRAIFRGGGTGYISLTESEIPCKVIMLENLFRGVRIFCTAVYCLWAVM